MAWDFSTDPAYQQKLDWAERFVREEVEPLDALFPDPAAPYDVGNPVTRRIARALKEEVRRQGLWACHLPPELGGQGYGQLPLALLNEILGRSMWAPSIFGTQAPDSGNAEILAVYGTEEQKRRYLQPLLRGEIVSCYAMTEPQGGSDPRLFRCRAVRCGEGWEIDGEKFFASNAHLAAFFVVMAITDPEVPVHRGSSMFLVPAGTPGLEIVRRIGLAWEGPGQGAHGYLRLHRVRVPAENLLGPEGEGFAIAQKRLGGGRLHHAMRAIGQLRRAFDGMCERALSREAFGGPLAEKGPVQQAIAESFIDIEEFRLLVLHTAWLMDRNDPRAREYVAAVKVRTPEVLARVVGRTMHLHGALGVSNEMPLGRMWMTAPVMGIVDGPTEVHRAQIARRVLRRYRAGDPVWPGEHLPSRIEAARRKYAAFLEHEVGNA